MIEITYDPELGLAKVAAAVLLKAGASVPVRVTFLTAPGSASALQLALLSDATPAEVLAFTDVFAMESATVATALLNANDTRLLTLLSGKSTLAVNAEFAGTLDGVRQIAPNFSVTVQPPGVTGPAASEGGPSYYSSAQVDAAIATAVAAGIAALPAAPAQPQRFHVALTSGTASTPILFPTAFATAPSTQPLVTLAAPGGSAALFEYAPDASSLTAAGFTLLTPAGVPAAGYVAQILAYP